MAIDWLSWLPYKSGFINSNILETLEDRPNTPQSLKFLEGRVHKLVGGPLNPSPQTTLWGAKGLDQEGLKYQRVKRTLPLQMNAPCT